MTSDDLRAYLDAHGVDGAPTVPGWCVIEWRAPSGAGHVSVFEASGDDGWLCMWVGDRDDKCVKYVDRITRHAPLPDFAAMARELEELRAKVANLENAAREDNGSAFRVGQVWESPTCLTYRVVGIRPSERFHPAQISMRQGADGGGRLFVKRGENTFGWRLMTP